MTALRNQRGAALVAALSLAMILLPLGALVVFQCRTDLLIEHNVRSEIEAFYVADAGLEHALAEIGPGLSFDPILVGPDGVAGTADDGIFPFDEGTPADFPPPLRYDVRASRSGQLLQLTSQATGAGGASKIVAALVARAPTPFSPAALYTLGDPARLTLGPEFTVSGFDHRLGDAPTAPTGSTAAVAALSSPTADGIATLQQQLLGDTTARLVGAGDTPSLATASSGLDVRSFALSAATRPERVAIAGGELDTPLPLGTLAAPQLSVVAGDLTISGVASGCGVLIIEGTLHLGGTFDFTGLIIALGGLVADAQSTLRLAGAFWRDPAVDERFDLQGSGSIVYSSDGLLTADHAFPNWLPRAAIVAGWQELL
jgi:hypothetical protein